MRLLLVSGSDNEQEVASIAQLQELLAASLVSAEDAADHSSLIHRFAALPANSSENQILSLGPWLAALACNPRIDDIRADASPQTGWGRIIGLMRRVERGLDAAAHDVYQADRAKAYCSRHVCQCWVGACNRALSVRNFPAFAAMVRLWSQRDAIPFADRRLAPLLKPCIEFAASGEEARQVVDLLEEDYAGRRILLYCPKVLVQALAANSHYRGRDVLPRVQHLAEDFAQYLLADRGDECKIRVDSEQVDLDPANLKFWAALTAILGYEGFVRNNCTVGGHHEPTAAELRRRAEQIALENLR